VVDARPAHVRRLVAGEDLRARAAAGLLEAGRWASRSGERGEARAALVQDLVREGLLEPGTPSEGDLDPRSPMRCRPSSRAPRRGDGGADGGRAGPRGAGEPPGHHRPASQLEAKLPCRWRSGPQDARFRRAAKQLAALRGGRRERRATPAGLEKARIPRATYRLQLHGEFTFKDATALLPYLARLGVSHVYCSPYLRARPGSKHGYDIVDHDAINRRSAPARTSTTSSPR
jgi:hypothetical protein